jgi:hypothetical protein
LSREFWRRAMSKFANIIDALLITMMIIFTASFILKYKDILQTSEMLSIIILAINATLNVAKQIGERDGKVRSN